MKKRNIIIAAVIAGVFLTGLVSGFVILKVEHIGISTGVCLVTQNGSCFLIKGNTPVNLSDLSEDKDSFSDYSTGDRLLVFHTGINESYPASTGVYKAIRIGKNNENEIPEDVVNSLRELGWIQKEEIPDTSEKCTFSAEYIRTGLPSEEIPSFPILTAINSEEELELYIRENTEKYGLNESFSEKTEKYDKDFFAEKSVIIILLEEGSGSVTHSAEKVLTDGENEISVYITREVPEVGTCDMAYHHILISLSKEDLKEKNIRLFIDGQDAMQKYEIAEAEKGYANISLAIPENWRYEINEGEKHSPIFGITLYHKSSPENTLSIEFNTAFGVCGTGLKTEDISISDYKASKGIYDGNPTWDYIVFKDTPGKYVIYNNTDGAWWNLYGEEAMEILDTIKIAKNILFEGHAREIAQKSSDGELKQVMPTFDPVTGTWTFIFENNEKSETVTVPAV